MTMQLLVARRYPRRIGLAVHLDTTRTTVDPATQATVPDPDWVLAQDYPLGRGERRGPNETEAAYRARLAPVVASIRADMKLRCMARLDELLDETDPGVELPGEGQAF